MDICPWGCCLARRGYAAPLAPALRLPRPALPLESWLHEGTLMDPNEAQEISERDQLWASLRALRPEIERLAAGDFESSGRQQQIIVLLARIVTAEMDYRARDARPDLG